MRINPGSGEAPPGTPQQAEQNLQLLLAEVAARGARPAAAPVRRPDADELGRYAFDLPTSATVPVRILMPGVATAALRDTFSASAPCIFVNGHPWWWHDAAGQTVHALRAAATHRP